MLIRPYEKTDADYQAIATIMQELSGDVTQDADFLKLRDTTRPAHCLHQILLAEQAGQVVGMARYIQYSDWYIPHHFWINVRVRPEYRQQGIGAQLYDALLAELAPHQPQVLKVNLAEDKPADLRFATQRSFVEYARRFDAILDLSTVATDAYTPLFEKLAQSNIAIRSFAALAADPERNRRVHALQMQLERDVPVVEPLSYIPFDEYETTTLQSPHFSAEGTFIACYNGDYIGLSLIFVHGTEAHIDITGVIPSQRGLGIATALKVRGMQFAQQAGLLTLHTTNDPVNQPILAINEKLGFVRQPARLQWKKELE